jgi:hypothetical protein
MSVRYRSIDDVVKGSDLPWPEEVREITQAVQRRGSVYLTLGLGIYGLGSILILYFMRNIPNLATAVVMFFFQLCVIYFATKVIYPCIGGGFWLSIAANRDSVPAFKRLAEQDIKASLEKASLDIQKAGDTIRNEVAELRKALTKPIVPPSRKIVAPPMEEFAGVNSAKGNGS